MNSVILPDLNSKSGCLVLQHFISTVCGNFPMSILVMILCVIPIECLNHVFSIGTVYEVGGGDG